jgi:hypothetical protein
VAVGPVISVFQLRGGRTPWNGVAWENQQVDLGFEFGDDPIPPEVQLPRLVLLPGEDQSDEMPDIPSHQVPGVLCVSGKAFGAVAKFLTRQDQVVPLRTRLGEYYAINVRRFVDCLDATRSEAVWVEEGIRAFAIHAFAFRPGTVPRSAIFRVREQSCYVLITEEVVAALDAAGVRGYAKSFWDGIGQIRDGWSQDTWGNFARGLGGLVDAATGRGYTQDARSANAVANTDSIRAAQQIRNGERQGASATLNRSAETQESLGVMNGAARQAELETYAQSVGSLAGALPMVKAVPGVTASGDISLPILNSSFVPNHRAAGNVLNAVVDQVVADIAANPSVLRSALSRTEVNAANAGMMAPTSEMLWKGLLPDQSRLIRFTASCLDTWAEAVTQTL